MSHWNMSAHFTRSHDHTRGFNRCYVTDATGVVHMGDYVNIPIVRGWCLRLWPSYLKGI